jgi:hypothetical protein
MSKYEIEHKGKSYTITLDYNDEMKEEINVYNSIGKNVGTYESLKECFERKFKTIENPKELLK